MMRASLWTYVAVSSTSAVTGTHTHTFTYSLTHRTTTITLTHAPRVNKYTDHHIQNEVLKILARRLLRKIAMDINEADYFALESDEVTGSSNKEQIIVCLRWVDSN